MNIGHSTISCGIHTITGFYGKPKAKSSANLKRIIDADRSGMIIVSLNESQYKTDGWDDVLKQVGFKKHGRTVRNPNSLNNIRLYVYQKTPVEATKARSNPWRAVPIEF